MTEVDSLLAVAFFIIAALYSSVGHAGASGYIAAMALAGLAPAVIRPTALMLNILVASIGVIRFARAKLVPWRLVLPFVLASAPAAYLGGTLKLPVLWYQRALAAVLAIAAVQLLRTAGRAIDEETTHLLKPPSTPVALVSGAGIGVVSGLTGTGGAIFLTPLLILSHWATTRIAAGASAVFVLTNSITGLLAVAPAAGGLPSAWKWWLAAVAGGAVLGTQFGRGALPVSGLRRVLAIVLLIAAGKLAFV